MSRIFKILASIGTWVLFIVGMGSLVWYGRAGITPVSLAFWIG